MSSRNNNCYICGNPFGCRSGPTTTDEIDGRERAVHKDCKLARNKALKDLERAYS